MLELPEVNTLARQVNKILKGKKVIAVFNATKLHKFTFYHGDPLEYGNILTGQQITGGRGYGIFVDLVFSNGAVLSIGDGVNMRYGSPGDTIPDNYQLLLGFEDESFLVFTVAMYGFISVYPDGVIEDKYHQLSEESISPLDDKYTEGYFYKLIEEAKKTVSVKGLLATEQRIPGVGNGVLQDILFNAKVHPKRKVSSLTKEEEIALFSSLKATLRDMTIKGGRDTQKDLFGKEGGYKTILCAKTCKQPCPVCGSTLTKEAYMGGTVYYCPMCQV